MVRFLNRKETTESEEENKDEVAELPGNQENEKVKIEEN